MQYTDKLFLVLLTSLTLFLAGCGGGGGGGSSSTSMMNKEPSELEKVQKAAEAAKNAAMTASTNADTEARKAETAAMNVVAMQTGNGNTAKMEATAARRAADAALAAYNTARAEYDKAKAAGNVTAAVEARVAAEEAKMQAEAQAKIAEDKAAEAVKITAMGLQFSDGAYRLGDASVTSGAPAATRTTGGVERKTGFIAAYNFLSKHVNNNVHLAIQSGGEQRAQPSIFRLKAAGGSGRTFYVGDSGNNKDRANIKSSVQVVTDSNDDKARLILYDKYHGSTTISGAYRGLGSERTATATSANPHGTVTVSGNAVPIMRASGEFRLASGSGALTESNVHNADVGIGLGNQNAREADGIYYYMSGSTKTWLKRKKTETSNQGAVTITYDNISVYENVTRVAIAVAHDHINYGHWGPLKEDGDSVAGLGIGFVRLLDGQSMTPSAIMETKFGSATYEGYFVAHSRAQDAQGEGEVGLFEGSAKITADFGKDSVEVGLYSGPKWDSTESVKLSGEINGNTFAGAKITMYDGPSWFKVKTTANGGKFTGGFNGAFFGPNAQEAGGVFDFTSEGKKDGELRGAFGGRRTTGTEK